MWNSLMRLCKSRLVTAALLVLSGAGGLWLWLAHGDSAFMLVLGAALLGLTAVAAVLWQARAREDGRLRSALDAYVEREIARHGRRHARQRMPAPHGLGSPTAAVHQ